MATQDWMSLIEAVVRRHPDGIAAGAILDELESPIPRRTLQYHLKRLVDRGRAVREGRGPSTRYRAPETVNFRMSTRAGPPGAHVSLRVVYPVPREFELYRDELRLRHLSLPADQRPPVGYRGTYLESYRPNTRSYLSVGERNRLRRVGQSERMLELVGTHARHALAPLLIDLSWNSSRLEGNTYSLLDTKRLFELQEVAEGRDIRETQMILNHKEAIEFLVDGGNQVGFDARTIRNLHAILANNLLGDPDAPGRLRKMPVEIGGSAYRPLDVPTQIVEYFDRLLARAAAIDDPFEQALFCLIHIPYLQPFDDVNKRVARLAANIPFIRQGLSPLSFNNVPKDYFTDAALLIYEQNEHGLMKELFLWAYEQSAARYGDIRQTLGEPDPFRLRHRDGLRELVGDVVRNRMDTGSAAVHIEEWVTANLEAEDRKRFREIVETDLIGLNEGNFARYRVTPGEFENWHRVWSHGDRSAP